MTIYQTTNSKTEDRAIGALLGLATGDALGTTIEFLERDTYKHLTDIVGGGPFKLKPGQWTDDTAMALALGESLCEHPRLDEKDLMTRFTNWYEKGAYSCTGTCFDIGNVTRAAIEKWRLTGNPLSGSTDTYSAGNGSLMRLAPVAIRHWQCETSLLTIAERQSQTTHGAAQAIKACRYFAKALSLAIKGEDWEKALKSDELHQDDALTPIINGSWRRKNRVQISSSGYVLHSLEASFWCVSQTDNFADAVLLAANLGDDADTTAAITGQLAGALYGAKAIPTSWLDKLAWKDEIETLARRLYTASLEDNQTSP